MACQTGVSRGSEQAFGFVGVQNPVESCQTALILHVCVDLVGQCLMPEFDRYLGRKERLLDKPRHQSVCLYHAHLPLLFWEFVYILCARTILISLLFLCPGVDATNDDSDYSPRNCIH